MDILEILREAKDPQSKGLVIEEDKDSGYDSGIEPIGGGDQNDNAPEEPETNEPEPQEEQPAEEPADAAGEDNPDENAEDPNITEPTDYTTDAVSMDAPTEDDPMGGDMGGGDTSSTSDYGSDQNEEEKEEDEETVANKRLLNDFVDLYYSIYNNINRLDELESLDIISSQIVIRGKHNLTKLHTYTYNYIVYHFSKGSYAENLYVFKNIIELYKIAIAMVRKIGK